MSNKEFKRVEIDIDIDPSEIKGDPINGQYFDMKIAGAYEAGTKIIKVFSEDGDINCNGALGTILGSLINDKNEIGYFICWDSNPEKNIFTCGNKIMDYETFSFQKRATKLFLCNFFSISEAEAEKLTDVSESEIVSFIIDRGYDPITFFEKLENYIISLASLN